MSRSTLRRFPSIQHRNHNNHPFGEVQPVTVFNQSWWLMPDLSCDLLYVPFVFCGVGSLIFVGGSWDKYFGMTDRPWSLRLLDAPVLERQVLILKKSMRPVFPMMFFFETAKRSVLSSPFRLEFLEKSFCWVVWKNIFWNKLQSFNLPGKEVIVFM